MQSAALSLNVLRTKSLVTALSAAYGTNSITCVTAHANLAVEQAGFCFGESCHGLATKSPYLIATSLIGYVQVRP